VRVSASECRQYLWCEKVSVVGAAVRWRENVTSCWAVWLVSRVDSRHRAIYIAMTCLSVCLSVRSHISQKRHVQTPLNVLYMLVMVGLGHSLTTMQYAMYVFPVFIMFSHYGAWHISVIVNSHSAEGASSAHVHCEEAALASAVNDCVPRDEVLMSTNCLVSGCRMVSRCTILAKPRVTVV